MKQTHNMSIITPKWNKLTTCLLQLPHETNSQHVYYNSHMKQAQNMFIITDLTLNMSLETNLYSPKCISLIWKCILRTLPYLLFILSICMEYINDQYLLLNHLSVIFTNDLKNMRIETKLNLTHKLPESTLTWDLVVFCSWSSLAL